MVLYILLIIFFYTIYVWLKKVYYWRRKSIKGPLPIPIVGNFGNVILAKQSNDAFTKSLYDRYTEEKFVGVYIGYKNALLVRDPNIIKRILITDFGSFHERGIKVSESGSSNNLFVADGDTWKTLRPKLTPIFTAKKLKEMFPIIKNCVDNLVLYIDKLIEGNVNYEMKSLISKYTTSVIGMCLFNVDFNVYSDQMKFITDMVNTITTLSMYDRLSYTLPYIFPGVVNYLPKSSNTELYKFFIKLVNTAFYERNGNISQKKDFIDILLQLKKDGKATKSDKNGFAEIQIDDEVIAAQLLVFFIANFETSSGTMSFLLYELALNENIQNRAYEEICDISKKYDDEISFEALENMTYLKMIYDETLRKYPILGTITRKSTTDYILPESNVKIEKGTLILISILGLHRDSKYFSDPDKFDPERFSTEARKCLDNTYMPFGAGPRQCIGEFLFLINF